MQLRELDAPTRALHVTYIVVPLAAGLDKFFNLLTQWPHYLSPLVARVLPVSPATFMHVVGVIEIAVGILMLTPWARWAAYVASAWLVGIGLNLLLAGFFDVAVRDLAMAVGAFALGRLLAARVVAHARDVERSPVRREPATTGSTQPVAH